MAYFNKSVMTSAGLNLLSRAFAGEITLEFVKLAAGSGTYTDSEKLPEALREATGLKAQKQQSTFSGKSVINSNTIALKSLLSNEQLTEGYYITEIGLYAKAAGADDGTAILYSIAVAEIADYMPEYNGSSPAQIIQEYYATVNDSAQITISVQGAVALAEDILTILALLGNTDISHIRSGTVTGILSELGRVLIGTDGTQMDINDTLFVIDAGPPFEAAAYTNVVFDSDAAYVTDTETMEAQSEDGLIAGKLAVSEDATEDAVFLANINK